MAELRHSTAAAAARASSSPAKRDSDASAASSPFIASPSARGRGGVGAGDGDDDGKDAHRSSPLLLHHHHYKRLHLPSPVRSLLALEDPRSPTASCSYRILLALLTLLVVAALFCVPTLWSRLNVPYLCHKEGITLHCPETKEPPSLWENPRVATTSWKPCAERRSDEPSDVPSERETSGYIFIHAEGGLNQQRIAICNAVAVAKIMGATLILPVLKQDQIWKDQTLVTEYPDHGKSTMMLY